MKRLLFIFLFAAAAWTGAAQVRFSPLRVDVGTIREVDGPVEAVFAYRNAGKEPLVVVSVATSCGCTGVDYPRGPLAPGDSAKMVVTYDPKDRPGAFEKQITVRTSAGAAALAIEGEVVPRPRTVEDDYPYLVAPGLRISSLAVVVDRAQVGKTFTRTVGVANVSAAVPAVVEVDRAGLPSWVEAKVEKSYLAAGERTQITVRLTGKEIGSFEADLPLTADGRRLAEKIWVSALFTRAFTDSEQGSPKLEVSQFFYHFSTRKLGEKLVKTFELKNAGTSDLVIDKVETTLPGEVRVTLGKDRLAPGEKTTLKVEAMPSMVGVFNEAVRLFTNQSSAPVRDIRVMANVQ